MKYEASSLFKFHKKKNIKPVIYLGLPKTSSTYLYHSFDCAENYLKSSLKEWFYLKKVIFDARQSNALYRCSTDNLLYLHQRDLLISFRDHINFYIDKSICNKGLINLKNSFEILFEDYSIDSYLKKFQVDGNFLVDFSINNSTFSLNNPLCKKQLADLTKKSDPIFLIGLRPFLPHLLSMVNELIYQNFTKNKITDISEGFILPKNFKDEFKIIRAQIIDSLIHCRKLFKRNFSYDELMKDLNLNIFFMCTNSVATFNSISNQQFKKNSIIFNSKNVTKNLLEILNRIKAKGVDVGDIDESKIPQTSMRKSNPELIRDFLLADEEIASTIVSIYNAAEKHYSLHLNSKFMDFFFPGKITKANLFNDYQTHNNISDIDFFDSFL